MHLADGILTHPGWGIALNGLGALGLGIAVQRIEKLPADRLAWAGTLGAFVLAAQAINLPVASGVSAHAIGSGLVTLILGPAAAIVVLAAVLLIQAVLLADGGLTVLGINLLNLAIIPALCMYGVSSWFGRQSILTAVGGTLLGSLVSAGCLASLLVGGAHSPAAVTYPLLVGVQGLAGLVEGILTWFALRQLKEQAPELLRSSLASSPAESVAHPGHTDPSSMLSLDELENMSHSSRRGGGALRWAAVALVILVTLPPLASESPDALEVVVEQLHAGEN